MTGFWKDYDPAGDRMEKKVGGPIKSIRFIPTCEMTFDDWAVLDWPNIRYVAKNRIARELRRRRLEGFNRVVPEDKPDDKEAYYWPASKGMWKSVEAPEWFVYEAEEEPSEDTEIIDSYVNELQLTFLYDDTAIIGLLTALKRVNACAGLRTIIEDGIYDRSPVWAHVLITALIIHFGFDRAFEMIEEEI